MKKNIVFIIVLMCLNCNKHQDTIQVKFNSLKTDEELSLTITEKNENNIRKFSEKYILFDINGASELTYTDKFYYDYSRNLFRVFEVKYAIQIENSLVHASDCLWIPWFLLESGLPNKSIFKTYSDRDYINVWEGREDERQGDVDEIDVYLLSIKYDTTYNDTIRTFLFDGYSPSFIKRFGEYKSYDSYFNLVNYTMVFYEDFYDSTKYIIDYNDYLKLKEFRKKYGKL